MCFFLCNSADDLHLSESLTNTCQVVTYHERSEVTNLYDEMRKNQIKEKDITGKMTSVSVL